MKKKLDVMLKLLLLCICVYLFFIIESELISRNYSLIEIQLKLTWNLQVW